MVSTTLTTLAAGQSSMTSSTNLHNPQLQQRTQSTLTAATTTATANNSNYQRSASSVTTNITSTTAAAAAAAEETTIAVQRQINNNNNNGNNRYNNYNSYGLNGNTNNNNTNKNNNNNNNIYVKSHNNSNDESGEFNHNLLEQQQQALNEDNSYQHYSTFNGKRRSSTNNNGANVTPTQLTAATTFDENTQYETSSQYETAKPTTTTSTAGLVNLSESLISASPPLNDQISLLFPKCRPKQQLQQQNHTRKNTILDENNSHNINGNDSEPTTVADVNLLMLNDDNDDDDGNNGDNQFSLHVTANSNKSNKKPITTSRTTTNYYKNVNIITQSPPPPSTSSVSSESLSSVTPRISTNPFLCSNNSEEEYISLQKQQQQQQQQHQQQQHQRYRRHLLPTNELVGEELDFMNSKEQLPVPSYNSFYYHTSKGDIPVTSDSNDMPRKRVAYNPGFHHQQQHAQNSKTNEDTEQCSPSNPFLKDSSSYWDRETSAVTSYGGPSNGLTTTGSLNDSGTELDTPRLTQLGPQTSRRTYQHHQTYVEGGADTGSGTHNGSGSGIRLTHHNSNRSRLAPSPIQRYNDHVPQQNSYTQRKCDTLPASKRMYQQHYQSKNKMSTSQSHGEASVNNNARYGYGHASTMDYWEKREKALNCGEYERERERKTFGDRERDIDRERERDRDRDRERMREYDWERVREPTRIRDWEHEGIRNWEQEREFERRREHDRERERERRERFREQADEEDRKRKHEHEHVARDIYEIGQQHLRQQKLQKQHKQKQENYKTMMSNGEVVVFDDINESWQNLRVTTETSTAKTSPTMTTTTTGQLTSLTAMRDDRQDYENELIFKELKRSAEKNYTMSLETRHGIIEYEGSPRRIGGVAPEESTRHNMANPKDVQDINKTPKTSQTTPICNSPPQYPARPGFPQRIISPPRDSTPPILLAAGKNSTNQQQQQQPQRHNKHLSQQQQQQQSQSLPQQSSGEYNAEDTSNDVSEIGTISDMHTPEAISPTVMVDAAAANSLTVKDSTLGSLYTPSTSYASSTLEGTNTLANGIAKTRITPSSTTNMALATTAAVTTESATITTATTTATATAMDNNVLSIPTKSSTFDYLYEFSETRKVLEEFFKCPSNEEEKPLENGSDVDSIDIQYEFHTTNLELDDGDMDNHDIEPDEDDNDAVDELVIDTEEIMPPHLDKSTEFKLTLQQQQQNKAQKQPLQHTQKHVGGKHQRRHYTGSPLMRSFDFFLDSVSRSSVDQLDVQENATGHHHVIDASPNYRCSPETTDCDSNCGDLDSLSGDINDIKKNSSKYTKYYDNNTQIPRNDVDVLSSAHTTDTENNNSNDMQNSHTHMPQKSGLHRTPHHRGGISMLMDSKHTCNNNSNNNSNMHNNSSLHTEVDVEDINRRNSLHTRPEAAISSYIRQANDSPYKEGDEIEETALTRVRDSKGRELLVNSSSSNKVFKNIDPDLDSLYSISVFNRPEFNRPDMVQMTPPPPAPAPHRKPNVLSPNKDILQPTPYIGSGPSVTSNPSVATAISSTLNRGKLASSATAASRTENPPPPIPERNLTRTPSPMLNSPVWIPRQLNYSANQSLLDPSTTEIHGKPQSQLSAEEDDIDTDLETDRLLGHQRLDDQGYYDENKSWDTRKTRSSLLSKISPKQPNSTKTRNGYNALLSSTPEVQPQIPPKNSKIRERAGSIASASSSEHSDKSPIKSPNQHHLDDARDDCLVATVNSPGGRSIGSGCISGGGNGNGNNNNYKSKDSDLLESSQNGSGVGSISGHGGVGGSLDSQTTNTSGEKKVKKSKNKEGGAVLIEGVLFRAKYLGSTQLVCEGQPTKSTRMMQAEEAVSRIKALAPDGDAQPSTEVDLFISTEKIMVLNTDLKEIMMDHALRTISYIADIGDLVVLMARRRFVPQDIDDAPKPNRTPKMICHVFESDEAQFIAQSIGQAFQVAYMEFLKANGIEDHSFVKEMDYQEVLNSQEIFGDELEIFAKKELQKEVVVPKAKGEILGVVIVESGWGSMLPTVVIANLMSTGAAARCGQLNIGDQLIAINGLSLVGLPLSTCQSYIKNTKNQTVVKFTVVPCAPVVEVKIKRPNTKYQLGFSVQNGVICSLLRGGIAERGGVRVGHRIIEINNQSVVAVPHEKIVNLLATSVGEILMKTMPTSMFRLLTGQENPIYI